MSVVARPTIGGSPKPAPIVAVIVTSRLGVLVARRNDGKPPWTFIAGEIEYGEDPADERSAKSKRRQACGYALRVL